MEWKNNYDACRYHRHGLVPLNATEISTFYSSYPRMGCDELSRSSKLLGLLLRGKIEKKFLSGNFFERDDINFVELMGCAIDCLITLMKIVSQKFVVSDVFPKNVLFGNKYALLRNVTVYSSEDVLNV